MQQRMCWDDAAWERSEAISDKWVRRYFEFEIFQNLVHFLPRHHRPGDEVELRFLEKGAYTISFQVDFSNANTAVNRFPNSVPPWFRKRKPGMKSTRSESSLNFDLCIVIDFVNHNTNMYDVLNTPAKFCFQLARPSFLPIGSPNELDDFTWELMERPLPMPMNTSRTGVVTPSQIAAINLRHHIFYFEPPVDLHIAHLIHQRNDAVPSAETVGAILTPLTDRLTSFDKGRFNLWCDDFRSANILLDEKLDIVGVSDWEFSYAAPVEFSGAPPWWLLIERPEYWPRGLEYWCRELKRMERLSSLMQDSWESSDLWISYAARNNFAFDLVYWHKIDQRFFGPSSSPVDNTRKKRLDLLTAEERDDMERIVAVKVEEMKTRSLGWDPDDYTKEAMEKASVDNSVERAVESDGQTRREDGDDTTA
ncbi:hypothetical protein BJY04DRAFT_210261 [Aspergillus karnatakaensis]|uniref:uncharacterized protein n=1 Tax=Aspergillus karnatakaensis TaxID=1810916 RepID=UPI003CCD2287